MEDATLRKEQCEVDPQESGVWRRTDHWRPGRPSNGLHVFIVVDTPEINSYWCSGGGLLFIRVMEGSVIGKTWHDRARVRW